MNCRTAFDHTYLQRMEGTMERHVTWRPPHRLVRVTPGAGGPGERYVLAWSCGQTWPSYLEYMHGLVHVRLGEEAHPLFATADFSPDSADELIHAAGAVFEASMDWFVERLVLEMCPERKAWELEQQFAAAKHHLQRPGALNRDVAVALALHLAKGRVFLKQPMALSGPLSTLVDAFDCTPAHKPSLFTLRALANRLLHPLHNTKADITTADGRHVWRLTPAAI